MILAGLCLTLGAALSFSGPAWGDAAATTWRAGDPGGYHEACGDAESMIALAERGGVAELWAVMLDHGQCFESPERIEGVLDAWIAGPFIARHTGVAGSVWRVLNHYGGTVFLWIRDDTGPHPARRQMSL